MTSLCSAAQGVEHFYAFDDLIKIESHIEEDNFFISKIIGRISISTSRTDSSIRVFNVCYVE